MLRFPVDSFGFLQSSSPLVARFAIQGLVCELRILSAENAGGKNEENQNSAKKISILMEKQKSQILLLEYSPEQISTLSLDANGILVLQTRPSSLSDATKLSLASFEPELAKLDLETEGLTICLKMSSFFAEEAGSQIRKLAKTAKPEIKVSEVSDPRTAALVRPNSALIPAAIEDVQGDARWSDIADRHRATSREARFDTLLIGDSLVQQMELSETWANLARFKPLNFGIGGDEVQHALWRFTEAQFGRVLPNPAQHPKAAVILVGTNNHRHTAGETAEGVAGLVKEIQRTWPSAKVILLGLLPRGRYPNPLRRKVSQVNLALVDKIPGVHYVDIGEELVEEDGTISTSKLHDYLHLTTQGYLILQRKLIPLLDQAFQG